MSSIEKNYQSLEYADFALADFALAEGGNPFFAVDPGLAIWTWLVFFTLLFVLYKFAWKPILSGLDSREAKIKKSISDAEQTTKELEEAIAKKKSVLNEANLEAKKIIDNSREQAEKIRLELEKEAKKNAEEIVATAKKKIEQETQKTMEEIKVHAVEIGFQVANKIIKSNLNSEKDNELSRKYLEEIS